MVTLGGGSTSITPTTPTPQPPKPSLSATAVPKAASPAVTSTCKSEVVKKKIPPVEPKPAPVSKPVVEGAVTGSGGLSIKSVEKINEEVPKKTSSSETSTHKVSDEESATKINAVKPPVKKSSTSFSVIDLSSDEDKSMNSKVESSRVNQITKSKDTEAAQSNKKEVLATFSSTTSLSPSVSSLADSKKEDNLEKEMDLVMNEILMISKQKSVDETAETLSPHATKESHVSIVVPAASKPQNPYQTQVQETSHQQNMQQSPVQHKHQLHNSASKQDKEKPAEVQHQKQVSQQSSPVQQKASPIQLTSPVQQQLSPVTKPQPSPTQKQQLSPAQKQQSTSSQKQLSSSVQKQQSSAQKQQANCSMQQHSSSHQQQSMQHSQSVSLQQTTAQHSLSAHQPKPPQHTSHPQHQKSQTQDQQQQSVKQESSHQKSQSQPYSMSHHQQSLGSSSWNKHDMPLPAKNSSVSTNKTPSSWASGHEVNPARQRQTEALPIGKYELCAIGL